jgi:hypothetical protein
MASFIAQNQAVRISTNANHIPLPVVNFSRWVCIVVIVAAMVLSLPILTTFLLIVYAPPVFLGRRYSLVGIIAKRLFAAQIANAQCEDNRLIHFNNTLIITLLAVAQVCFYLLNAPVWGWVFSLFVVAANGLALVGFCIGCVFFFGLKLNRIGFFGRGW